MNTQSTATVDGFAQRVAAITARIAGRPLDQQLERELNTWFPADAAQFRALRDDCLAGISAGWMCAREAGGIRFGRVIKPGADTHGFSVDVVDMQPVAGPHHRHPNGEIDLVMPLEAGALFDGRGAGWVVYPPESAHRPTVTRGRALVLYLLPAGAIEFTKT
jgi:hypothetical protein